MASATTPAAGETKRENTLDQIRRHGSLLVTDTADADELKAEYHVVDCTTNPSLLLKASERKNYESSVADAVAYGIAHAKTLKTQVELAMDKLTVNVGARLLALVPGVVSTEVDARLSFDTAGSVAKARELIALYKQIGVDKNRVLIKLAGTWEGIRAAETLEAEGIHTNITLIFSLAQARAASDAGAFLISPFVGRILDWHVKNGERKTFTPEEDPGVKSVIAIYNYLKSHESKTIVMGASFRNLGEIIALAGVDRLTIGPSLLDGLLKIDTPVTGLTPPARATTPVERLDEKTFRWLINDDPMATEKLAEGIRLFAADCLKLERTLTARVQSALATATATATPTAAPAAATPAPTSS